MRQLPDTVGLVLPDNWREFPLDPAEATRQQKVLLDQFSESGEVSRTEARRAQLFLAELLSFARDQGTTFVSTLLVDAEGENGPILASVVVSTVHRRDVSGDMPLLPDLLMAAYADRPDESSTRLTATNLEPPAVLRLGSHEAVRLVRLFQTKGPDPSKAPAQFVETYLVPVSEGDGLVTLTFTTTNTDKASELSRLFNGIAQTIRVLYPDEPTLIDG